MSNGAESWNIIDRETWENYTSTFKIESPKKKNIQRDIPTNSTSSKGMAALLRVQNLHQWDNIVSEEAAKSETPCIWMLTELFWGVFYKS